MEFLLGKITLNVESGVGGVCDGCRSAHLKCNRALPTCARCRKQGLTCKRGLEANRKKERLFRLALELRSKEIVPLSWAQAIESHTQNWNLKFCMRQYLIPLVLLLPKPNAYVAIEGLVSRAFAATQLPTKNVAQHSAELSVIQDTFVHAIKTFFRLFNPFYPLFSEEGFHSRPRSKTLLKIVIQMGLERMQETELTRAAIVANDLTQVDFEKLPPSLDTLQCHLLVHFGLGIPGLKKVHERLSKYTSSLFPLLGLHLDAPKSPQWLERILAAQLNNYAYHRVSLGQFMSMTKFWNDSCPDSFKPDLVFKKPELFPHTSDQIHFIKSQFSTNSVSILCLATKEHTRALHDKVDCRIFLNLVKHQMKKLEENFKWGWRALSRLNYSTHKQLVTQSRLMVALRYHDDYIHLAKLSLYIPKNLTEPLSQTPILKKVSEFSRRGLVLATRSIHLASTINPHFVNFDYVRNFIPAVAFVMLHFRLVVAEYGHAEPLSRALSKARACLVRAQGVPFYRVNSTCYLELFDFLVRRNKIQL